jgi:hypothetical protein
VLDDQVLLPLLVDVLVAQQKITNVQRQTDRPTDRRTYEKSKTEKLACFESPPAKLVVSDEKAPPVAGKSKQIKGCEI